MRYFFADFELDEEEERLSRRGRLIPLPPQAQAILQVLLERAPATVSKEALLREVWGDVHVSASSLPRAVLVLRRGLGAKGERIVATVRGRGYRIGVPVRADPEGVPVGDRTAERAGVLPGETDVFVGRGRQLALIERALASARRGRGGVVLLVGEAGIGKTRLAEEFARVARASGVEVLVARCAGEPEAPAYWPWSQIARGLAEKARGPEELGRLVGDGAADLQRLIPELREQMPDLPAPPALRSAEARFRLFDHLAGLVRRRASQGPLVLVLDDLHRADPPSLRMLEFLARELRGQQVLLLGTYRDTAIARDDDRAVLLARIARSEACRSVLIEPLHLEETARFVTCNAASPVSAHRVADLHAQSGGNPFFLSELVRLLEEDRTAPLPSGVGDVVRRHLDGLERETVDLLRDAAVLGHEFELAALIAMREGDSTGVLGALDPALRARIARRDEERVGRFCFAHRLLRDAIYQELPAVDRMRRHGRAARALEGLPRSRASEIAHHYFEAAPAGDAERAVEWAHGAAREATDQLAFEEATTHLGRALQAAELIPGLLEPERCDLLLDLGAAQTRAGEPDRARATLMRAAQAARTARCWDRLARAAALLAGFAGFACDHAEVSLYREALQHAPPESAQRARLLAALGRSELADTPDARHELSALAVSMARRVGDPVALAEVLVSWHWTVWLPENAGERLAVADELVALGQRLRRPDLELEGINFRVLDLLEVGERGLAEVALAQQERIAEGLRHSLQLWRVRVRRALFALMRGELELGESLAGEALEIGRREKTHAEDARQAFDSQRALLLWMRGDIEQLERPVRESVLRDPDEWSWRASLAHLHALLGQEAEARREFEVLAAGEFEDVPRNRFWLMTLCMLVEVSVRLRDTRRAQRLYELLLPYEDRSLPLNAGVVSLGATSQYLARLASALGRWDEAARHYEHALKMNERIQALPWLAYTYFQRAAMQLERGGADALEQARADLESARAIAEPAGLLGVIRFGNDLHPDIERAGAVGR